MKRYVVCLCGSGRFWSEILDVAAELTLKGYVVLQPNFNTKQSPPNHTTADEKKRLDLLHLDKIRMADEVLIVCPEGYVGESTAFELFFAKRMGKAVSFTHAREFAAQASATSFREFLRAADRSCCTSLLLDPVPKFDELFDQLIAVCARTPIPKSRVSRAQSVLPAAARHAATLHGEIGELRKHLAGALDLLEHAWGVIANAPAPDWGGGGDPDEWVKIAKRWRDAFLLLIKPDHPVMLATATLRKQAALRQRAQQIIDLVRGRPTTCSDLVRDVEDVIRELGSLLDADPTPAGEPAEG